MHRDIVSFDASSVLILVNKRTNICALPPKEEAASLSLVAVSPHILILDDKEVENDVLKYQNNHAYLLSEVSHEINKCPSMLSHLNLFIEGYGSTKEHPILIPSLLTGL